MTNNVKIIKIKAAKDCDGLYIHNKTVIYQDSLKADKNFIFYKKIISAILSVSFDDVTSDYYYFSVGLVYEQNILFFELIQNNFLYDECFSFNLNERIYVDFKNNIFYDFKTKYGFKKYMRKLKLEEIYENI